MTGGGWPVGAPPSALRAEALTLLRAVLAGFRAWGRFPVVTTVDSRSGAADLPADEIVVMDAGTYPTALPALARRCGAALVIAPEDGGVLERVTRLLQDAGVLLLGSEPRGVAVAADKWECSRRFAAAGLPAPRTMRTTPAAAAATALGLGFPLVVKPVRGAGCAGVSLVAHRDELEPALALDGLRGAESLLLQEYVHGPAASVSLLVAGGRAVCLSFNSQVVTPGIPFTYEGGTSGIRDGRRDEAFALAERVAALVPGLRGYVGVDLVLGSRRTLGDRDQCEDDDVVRRTASGRRHRHRRGHMAGLPIRRAAGGGRNDGHGDVRQGGLRCALTHSSSPAGTSAA